MPFLRIAPILGAIMAVFGLTFWVPLGVSHFLLDGAADAFFGPMLLCVTLGMVVWTLGRRGLRNPNELQARDGMLLVGLAWSVLPALAALPLWLHFRDTATPMSWSGAYFEAMSGLTTTGSTVLTGLDHLPVSINLWRCFLQWLGGMGILVLAVAILPMLGVGGSQMFRAEATGPMKDTKLTPRITETAKGLWTVYCLLSLLCVGAYWWGGMSMSDAWIHMFSTMSLGGLSSHDSSFAYFNSPLLEGICIVFMLIASCNFALYFVAFKKRSPGRIWRDAEWRGTVLMMLGCSVGVAALLVFKGTERDVGQAFRMAIFNVVSIASTTGYATVDYTQWPIFAPILMIMLSGLATSAGSTGAGIKMARLLILLKQARREMKRLVHPKAVIPITNGGSMVDNATIFSILAFMMVYGATIVVLTMGLLLTDMPFDTALSAIIASVNNMGPGLNEVGPVGNYASLTATQLWVCTLAMLLGRLEMLSFLVLFTRGYWRK
ncbi:MAG: Trk system potassium uptake protein TrkH [Pseudomonadota bacterium]|jgi:trk system potassium uptake protein TrkH